MAAIHHKTHSATPTNAATNGATTNAVTTSGAFEPSARQNDPATSSQGGRAQERAGGDDALRPQSTGRDTRPFVVLCSADGSIRFVSLSFATLLQRQAESLYGRKFTPFTDNKDGTVGAGAGATRTFTMHVDGASGERRINWEETTLAGGERLYVGAEESPTNDAERASSTPNPSLHIQNNRVAAAPGEKASEPFGEAQTEGAGVASEAVGFLATMSHEMRTPLNGIIGMTGLLIDSGLNPHQRAYADAIRDSGKALLTLINDLLDHSKMNAGKLTLDTAPFDVTALVQGVCELLAAKADEKGVEVAAFIDPEIPGRIIGDEARLRQILTNLAGNGVKFTDIGGVAIEVRSVSSAEGTVRLDFAVRDTGVGISPEAQRGIFEAFDQADAHGAKRSEGTGLGLSISRRLAEAMGGKISVESTVGEGSVFSFTAEFGVDGPVTAISTAVAAPAAPIVVAAQSETVATTLSHYFDTLGVGRYHMAPDAATALSILTATPGATLFADLEIATESGEALAQAATRAMVLVSPNKRDAIEAVRASGFDGYLVKPIRRETLFRALDETGGDYCERAPFADQSPVPDAADATPSASSQPRSSLEAAKATAQTHPALALVDAEDAPALARSSEPEIAGDRDGGALSILLAEDNRINAVLATALMERSGHQVTLAENGEEAIRLAQAGTFDMIFMDMHMPVLDGLEATRQLRALAGRTASTPIIALTANAMASDRIKCLEAGMDDFLSKPFEAADLENMLEKWVARAAAPVA
ncbi:MAG: response regulator [Pseudomonadota bacterium]